MCPLPSPHLYKAWFSASSWAIRVASPWRPNLRQARGQPEYECVRGCEYECTSMLGSAPKTVKCLAKEQDKRRSPNAYPLRAEACCTRHYSPECLQELPVGLLQTSGSDCREAFQRGGPCQARALGACWKESVAMRKGPDSEAEPTRSGHTNDLIMEWHAFVFIEQKTSRSLHMCALPLTPVDLFLPSPSPERSADTCCC